jgi:hypothetical protein
MENHSPATGDLVLFPNWGESVLRAVPSHWFSWDFSLFDNGRRVAAIKMAWLRARAEFDIQGEAFEGGPLQTSSF